MTSGAELSPDDLKPDSKSLYLQLETLCSNLECVSSDPERVNLP